MQPFILLSLFAVVLNANEIFYTEWNANPNTDASTYVGTLSVTRPNGAVVTVTVEYTPPTGGISFVEAGSGTDYFSGYEGAANPPYTGNLVSNAPPTNELIAMQYQGLNILTFSQPLADIVLSVVSLNSNSYVFPFPFVIDSCGGQAGKACGYWGGCGPCLETATGSGTYTLSPMPLSAEMDGNIYFNGSFSSLNWTSTASENWNGFTMGSRGLAEDYYPSPSPSPSTCVASLETIPAPTSGCCALPSLYCLHITPAVALGDESVDDCYTVVTGSGTFTIQTPGQKVFLSSNAQGTESPYFDDMAILTAVSPSGVVRGENVVAWQETCVNPAYTTVTIPTTATSNDALDVSSLFGGEAGAFKLNLTVLNGNNPYSALDAYICTGTSLTGGAISNLVREDIVSDGVSTSTAGAAQGMSVNTVVFVAIGSAVGTTMVVLLIVGVIGYFVIRKNGASPQLTEKFVYN